MKVAMASIATIGFGCGLAAGLLLALSPGRAAAAYEYVPGMVCQPSDPSSAHTYLTQAYGSWIENSHATNSATFVCPVPDYTDLPATTISAIYVSVYDGSASKSVSVRACAWDGAGEQTASCGVSISTGDASTGHASLSPSLYSFEDSAYIFDAGETGYVYVSLPDLDIYASRLNNIYVEN